MTLGEGAEGVKVLRDRQGLRVLLGLREPRDRKGQPVRKEQQAQLGLQVPRDLLDQRVRQDLRELPDPRELRGLREELVVLVHRGLLGLRVPQVRKALRGLRDR